ncbi:lysophospholipid acyltransferase family protein [Massilia sp. W12]|uniref:lysophospholipid acyltransferase family protein n=1 Tax=Massilia sp. W12 TaxID=3126507 RepID=UPI0030CD1FAD
MKSWRALRMALHLVWGLANCALLFPWISEARRQRRTQAWSRQLLGICKIKLEVVDAGGLAQAEQVNGGEMLISNHVSWLDIFVINSMSPCHFVAKSDIRDWPLVGWLCEKAGTIFIARGKRRDVRRIFQDMVARIEAGDRVAFFPEGTTSAQGQLLPFHANLFEAAIDARVPLQPLALSYLDAQGAPAPAIEFTGDTSFMDSMWLILANPGITARLQVLPLISTIHANRRDLARTSWRAVAGALQIAEQEGEEHAA